MARTKSVVGVEPVITIPTGSIKGKTVSSLHEGLKFTGLKATGKLNLITDYTGFDTNVANQSGYYLPMKITLPSGTVKATLYFDNQEYDVLKTADNVLRLGFGGYSSQSKKIKLVYVYKNNTYIRYIDILSLEYKFTSQWNEVELFDQSNARYLVFLDTGNFVEFINGKAKVSDVVKLRLQQMGIAVEVGKIAKIGEGKIDTNIIG